MKINYMSDLHLDISKDCPVLSGGGDVLVLAGDICEAEGYNKTAKTNITRFFKEECAGKYDHVLIVPGNHEHYRHVFEKTVQRMRDNLPKKFRVLDNQTANINGVLFVAGTMWTDLNRDDPITKQVLKRGLNDFAVIKREDKEVTRAFTVEDSYDEHQKTIAFFKSVLGSEENISQKVVVISHHAPSVLSVADQYRHDVHFNGGFFSRLEDLMLDHPQIKLWIHGHTHTKFDYTIGGCRVVCNPRGYQSRYYNEKTGFDVNSFVEV